MTTKPWKIGPVVNRFDDFVAADVVDPARLVRRIGAGVDINAPILMTTPLAIAASGGHVRSCELLLRAGADPNIGGRGNDRGSVLCELFDSRFLLINKLAGITEPVIADNAMEIISTMLVEYGANPNGGVSNGETIITTKCPLFIAVTNGDIKGVEVLVRLGANIEQICVEEVSGYVKTAMSEAAQRKDEDMMIALLRLGAYHGKYGNLTGFQYCVELGCDKVVEYYIRERGEDINQTAVIVNRPQTLVEIAIMDSTKRLLMSLATEMAVQDALGRQNEESQSVVAPKKSGGMML